MQETQLEQEKPKVAAVKRTEAIPEAGILGKIINRGGIIFATGIFLAMLILIQEIFLRYLFNAPTIWAHETTIFLCAMAFIYGGLYCVARDSHVRVVILYDLAKGHVRRVLDVVISIICLGAATFFAWASVYMVQRATLRPDGSFRLETSGSAWDPPSPAILKIFLLIVLVFMAIQFLVLAVNHMRAIFAKPGA